MDKSPIPDELQPILKKLCDNLNTFLCKTETSLEIAHNRLEQVQYVLQPWNLSKQSSKNDFDESSCNCESLKSDKSKLKPGTGTTDDSLFESITKTLTTAQSLRSKNKRLDNITSKASTNTSKKSSKARTISSAVKYKQKLLPGKPKRTSVTNTSSTTQSLNISQEGTSISIHNPSCPLYHSDTSASKLSNLSLTDALSVTKIPLSLSQTIKQCNKFLENFEINTKEDRAKLNYLHLLEQQNHKSCIKFEANYSPGEIFMKYLSALHSHRNKYLYLQSDYYNWVFYTNVEDVESYQLKRSMILTKESWNQVLLFIIDKIIPALENCKLDIMQKLFVQKMLKTICNFTQCSIPRVPIFKINPNDD